MPFSRILRLGLINVAVALTAVPINGVLNRIMISELALPATLVALLVALPYLFSPVQIWIGGFADTHPVLGMRRTPYIVLGLALCAGGSALAPTAALMLGEGWHSGQAGSGILLALAAFGAWGMGFNCSTVSYLSLATELSGEQHRARTIGIMWFMLIAGVIVAGISIGRMLRVYSEAALLQAFYATCGTAFVLGLLALIGLEKPGGPAPRARQPFSAMVRSVAASAQARLFFAYLILLLVAILGQDVLLEPFAADLLGVPVEETTRYTSIWGAALLAGLLIASPLARRAGKTRTAALGGALVVLGLVLIAASGLWRMGAMLVPSLLIFGLGSGVSTAANLALMLDMTVAGRVGVFVGAWGMADALARLLGALVSGVMRDSLYHLTGSKAIGYVSVFVLEALVMCASLLLLPHLSVARFRDETAGTLELMALAGETSQP
jgi:BCD family chlorophyll transporter-like MFS transporter